LSCDILTHDMESSRGTDTAKKNNMVRDKKFEQKNIERKRYYEVTCIYEYNINMNITDVI